MITLDGVGDSFASGMGFLCDEKATGGRLELAASDNRSRSWNCGMDCWHVGFSWHDDDARAVVITASIFLMTLTADDASSVVGVASAAPIALPCVTVSLATATLIS